MLNKKNKAKMVKKRNTSAKMAKMPNFVTLLKIICCSLSISIASAAAKTTDADINVVIESGGVGGVERDAVTPPPNHQQVPLPKDGVPCTDLARDDETLMVFSTLGGGLTAIDPITSTIRWTIADEPPIMADQQQNVQVPQYLPDPRDGSIYQLGDMGDLKKLPYTIPQLVASAPCRSSDGILYSGKKSDTWFIVDPKSGRREKVMGFGGPKDSTVDGEQIGWATSRAIYLGRTQYTVMMYDSLSKNKNVKPWNITFYDYNAVSMTPDISKEYEYIHLTTTSNGNIVTLDRSNGKFLWKHDLTSPVVAAFLLGPEGLLSVPFTTVSDEAFNAILEESKGGNVNTVKLFQSLYVGEHTHGLYALPSLVDKNTPRISTTPPIKLLNGPDTSPEVDPNTVYLNEVIKKNAGIILGHYNLPPPPSNEGNNMQLSPTPTKTASNHDLATIHKMNEANANFNSNGFSLLHSDEPAHHGTGSASRSSDMGVQTDPIIELTIDSNNAFNKTKKIILANSNRIQKFINEWFMDHPSGKVHQVLIVLVLAMVTMFWYMCATMRELKYQSENGSKTYSNGSKGSGSSNINAQDLIDLGDGNIRVGKISFNSNEVLGKGCEGTFVFKGTFEERFVAVKRLLPECFTFADREVALLRESDAHENVVRYFCTEQDRQFRYIAVELCAATLQDYTEGERCLALRAQIDVYEVMRQAVAGLTHLHSLNIVHRDIKPQNVLLSLPDVNGAVRVMISDFGLCKKLNFGKASFSRRSGVTGTDGWIAPEMMRGQRTTTSVDIFSLGCVYYYVLSGGHHAFGDALKRQANILSNEFNLNKLKALDEDPNEQSSRHILAEQLIADMINRDPQLRPPARCISNHPIFWNDQKVLAFLQDVSDRVEKLQFHVEPLKTLEKNGRLVVRDDWNLHMDPLITEDLRKYRGYMGASVRDLLRAMRNKKHHYHELDLEVQQAYGCIPHEFTNYWIKKFPNLISHVYHAFSICSKEPALKPYYNADYQFTRPAYFDMDDALFPLLMRDPKPLLKQTNAASGGGSPKRQQQLPPPRTPDKAAAAAQQNKTRKGLYNFRKNYNNGNNNNNNNNNTEAMEDIGDAAPMVGLQRNLANEPNNGEVADDDNNRKDVFANFKFRRFNKTSNRNGGNGGNGGIYNYNNNYNNNNRDNNRDNNKNTPPWILTSTENQNDKED